MTTTATDLMKMVTLTSSSGYHLMKSKQILIAHYRVGKTDGVPLEIAKRKMLLTRMGHQVSLLSGPNQHGANVVIDEFEFDAPPLAKLWQNTITACTDYASADALKADLWAIEARIERQLERLFSPHAFDLLYVHNILSMAINLLASIALVRTIQHVQIPCVAIHHDFYWEGDITTTPTVPFVEEIIRQYLVPQSPFIKHVTINTLNHEKLMRERGIQADVNYDVFDFDQPQWRIDEYNRDFRMRIGLQETDLMILQATRIVPNKAIEFAIEFVAQLQRFRHLLENKPLYHGKLFRPSDRIVFVLSGYTEQARTWYKERLKDLTLEREVQALFLEDLDLITPSRTIRNNRRYFSFWDPYVFADLVTFPAIWEGWGNQFIEAVFAKKPVVLFEYPVFQQDIAPEGYRVISLGDSYSPASERALCSLPAKSVRKAAKQAITLLLDSRHYTETVDTNFAIGSQNHSSATLKRYLQETLAWATSCA
jgi:mannosylglucosylglycerate synthase